MEEIEFDTDMLRWALRVLDGLNEVGTTLEVTYGEYHLGEIPILFDDEKTNFLVSASEFDIDGKRYALKWRKNP